MNWPLVYGSAQYILQNTLAFKQTKFSHARFFFIEIARLLLATFSITASLRKSWIILTLHFAAYMEEKETDLVNLSHHAAGLGQHYDFEHVPLATVQGGPEQQGKCLHPCYLSRHTPSIKAQGAQNLLFSWLGARLDVLHYRW